MNNLDPKIHVFIRDILDLINLRRLIQEADILYNMAGVVTLSSKPSDFAKVITLNGFAQAIIAHFIQEMGR